MQTVVFYLAGATCLGSALSVVMQRNPFQAALSLILNLFSLAVLFFVLQADFVGVAQVLVYAGAVMVMFLFVIAYLGDRAHLELRRGGVGSGAAVIAGLAIFLEITISAHRSEGSLSTPAAVTESFGSPQRIGALLLTDHLLAFEVISLLLLVGAIAGVVLGAGPLLSRKTAKPPPGAREPLFDLARARSEIEAAQAAGQSAPEAIREVLK